LYIMSIIKKNVIFANQLFRFAAVFLFAAVFRMLFAHATKFEPACLYA